LWEYFFEYSRRYFYIFSIIMHNADILALAGLRVDGRKPEDIRRIRFTLGIATDVDGSAYYEQVGVVVIWC
jgi:exosome complex component RRP41